MDILDSIVVDRVPVSALNDILSLSGVVLVEQQNVLEPYLNVATKAPRYGPVIFTLSLSGATDTWAMVL